MHVWICCVRFNFLNTVLNNWLGRSPLKTIGFYGVWNVKLSLSLSDVHFIKVLKVIYYFKLFNCLWLFRSFNINSQYCDLVAS